MALENSVWIKSKSNKEFPRLDSVPFESQHQYMATLHDSGSQTLRLVYVKGAVEVVLPRCQSLWIRVVSRLGSIRPRFIRTSRRWLRGGCVCWRLHEARYLQNQRDDHCDIENSRSLACRG